jgi:3-oxoadipate enol-lactonase
MSSRQSKSGLRRWTGRALALAAVGGVAGAVAAQHRVVRRALRAAQEGAPGEDLELPADLVHHEIVTDDGATIRVVERGQGPPLLLLHGLGLSSDIWVHQFTDLADRHRVVAVDLRGHGRSSSGERALRLETMADDVHAVVKALDLSGCLLVGHSMGGMVALQLVQTLLEEERRARFEGLVIVSSAAGPFITLPGWRSLTKAGLPLWSRMLLVAEEAGAWAAPAEDLRWWAVRIGFGAEPVPAQVRFVERIQQATPAATLAQLLPILVGVDLSVRLADVELPALVVAGEHDRLIPSRYTRRLAHALSHGQLVELPRCGHMPMLERRREFSRLLDEFFAKLA